MIEIVAAGAIVAVSVFIISALMYAEGYKDGFEDYRQIMQDFLKMSNIDNYECEGQIGTAKLMCNKHYCACYK